MFSDEKSMVSCFIQHLQMVSSPWGSLKFETEFYYQRGRTDVVAVAQDGTVIAFEAKLRKWKEALHQAYRNLCFANASFVVMPQAFDAEMALHQGEFRRFGIGLWTLSEDRLDVIYQPPAVQPLQPWLKERASKYVLAGEMDDG